jgi:hypothetical protein
MLLKGGPAGERWCSLKALTSTSLSGVRPGDWDARWVQAVTALPDGSVDDAGGCHLGYYQAVDLGDVARGWRLLQRALDASGDFPASIRSALGLELDAAFHLAYYCNDAAAGRSMLKRASGKVDRRCRYKQARAEAAVLSAEGRFAEASAMARHGVELLNREGSRLTGEQQMELEWLHSLIVERPE